MWGREDGNVESRLGEDGRKGSVKREGKGVWGCGGVGRVGWGGVGCGSVRCGGVGWGGAGWDA